MIDRVLAVAAGNVIMLSDVAAARELGLVAPASSEDPVREILSRLINRALILAEVERYAPPEPGAEAVDREFDAVRSRYRTGDGFQTALARVGVNEKHLRETLRQELRIRAYLDQRFTVATPGDDEIERYYRDHPQAFTRNGNLAPLDQVRADVAEAVRAERRGALVDEWLAGLRRRADIVDLYLPRR